MSNLMHNICCHGNESAFANSESTQTKTNNTSCWVCRQTFDIYGLSQQHQMVKAAFDERINESLRLSRP